MKRKYTLNRPARSASTIDYQTELNPQQYAAVTSPPGPALVIAGAGSGKTRTLTFRVAWLLEQGVPARNILLLTFTNKASREMLERVAALLPEGAEGIWGGTFHSIGNRILRRHAEQIGFRERFTILDRSDQEDLINGIVAREGLRVENKKFPKGSVLADIFSYSVNTGVPIMQVLVKKYDYFIRWAERIEALQITYEARKKETNGMDFDDLLSKTLELFTTCPDVAEIYQNQFRHVLVDEYQDTNSIQSALVDSLAFKHGSVMVVGDDAQSIYSWRGANFENILRFPKDHPGARVFKIETNYRSVPEVLQVANAAILANENQFPKNLAAVRSSHPVRPALVALATNHDQANFVAQRVQELQDQGIDLSEMAILYRAHYHSMEVQLALTRQGTPFLLTSGLRFFEQAHIKDVASFLRFVTNPRDEVSFKRMVRLLPGIGEKSAETLWGRVTKELAGEPRFGRLHELKVSAKAQPSWVQLVHTLEELSPAGAALPPSEMIESVVMAMYEDYMQEKFPNFEARREDLATLAGYAREFEQTEDFLSQLALLGSTETTDALERERAGGGKITLSTIHQAKGLEWKVVFLIWLADGMFPNARGFDDPAALEEERRLFYVGVTRCMDELYLTYPEFRTNSNYGDPVQRPSRFLFEIPEPLMDVWDVGGSDDFDDGIDYDDEPF